MPARSLRITLVIHSLNGGGAERQITSLAHHLADNSMLCTLMTLDHPGHDRYAVDPRVKRIGLDAMNSSRSVFESIRANRKRILALRQAIQESQPDCVVSFCDKMNIVALAACHPLSVPIVISERSDPRQQNLGWLWEAARRWQYPRCSACVVQTAGVAKYLRPILGNKKKIEIIPSAIDPPLEQEAHKRKPVSELSKSSDASPKISKTQATTSQNNQTKRLLYVGRLSYEKGPDRLLQAWSTLAAKHPSWKLSFIGDGPLESQLKHRCHELSLDNQVEFLGWQEDVWSHLYQSQAFVLPSRYEGFPGALIEAMYARLPIVTTNCSDSIFEMIDHKRNGLVAENTSESLTATLDQLMSNESLQHQLGHAASEKAMHYVWQQIGLRWIKMIEATAKPNYIAEGDDEAATKR